MKTAIRVYMASTLSALAAAAGAADSTTAAAPPAVDTSKWKCELCKFEDGLTGSVDVGAGYVSDKSYKFGEYNGLYKDGGYFLGDGTVRYRGKDATYWNANASNLGLDTRSLDAEGGRQGRYKLQFNYDELPHLVSDPALTPFVGSGGAWLSLPAGFPAGSTTVMPLAGTLRPVELETTRKTLGVGGSWTPAPAWNYGVNFRHETRDGRKGTAGSFFVNAAQLVAPVDYETDQIDAFVSYTDARFQAKFAYYGSLFRNSNAALTWQNPYTLIAFPGAVAGQLALPPDNQFHQLSATLGYQFTSRTRAMADIAFGRMTQDEAFLAPTLNAALAVPPLPGASLDGRVDTLNANVRVTSSLTDQLRVNAAYVHNDRDNRTPQAVYGAVTTDMFVAAPRRNLPYGFTQDKLGLRADYTATAQIKGAVGYDHDSFERTFQEVDKTRENTIWGKITTRPMDNVDLTLKLAHGERDNTGYQTLPAVIPPENPLMRKYNMADRRRDSGELRADIAAADGLNIGLQVSQSEDKYSASAVGLTSGKDFNISGDVTMVVTEQVSLHFFANHQIINSKQAGSQAFATPDWRGENEDTVDFFGIGVKYAAIKDKLDVGADYTRVRSKSAITGYANGAGFRFPDLHTSRDGLKLYADYRLKDGMSLRLGYWYESYDSENWMVDSIAPNTIPNVLTLGQQSPNYDVHVIAASVRYKF